jgi:hypothetical protein
LYREHDDKSSIVGVLDAPSTLDGSLTVLNVCHWKNTVSNSKPVTRKKKQSPNPQTPWISKNNMVKKKRKKKTWDDFLPLLFNDFQESYKNATTVSVPPEMKSNSSGATGMQVPDLGVELVTGKMLGKSSNCSWNCSSVGLVRNSWKWWLRMVKNG